MATVHFREQVLPRSHYWQLFVLFAFEPTPSMQKRVTLGPDKKAHNFQ